MTMRGFAPLAAIPFGAKAPGVTWLVVGPLDSNARGQEQDGPPLRGHPCLSSLVPPSTPPATWSRADPTASLSSAWTPVRTRGAHGVAGTFPSHFLFNFCFVFPQECNLHEGREVYLFFP